MPNERVRLTPLGLERWQKDEKKRQNRKLPLRGIVAVPDLEVVEFTDDGRCFVYCPFRAEGVAPLLQDEWILVD